MASAPEGQIRGQLRIARLLSAYLPLGIANWLIEQSTRRVILPPDIKREDLRIDSLRCVWLVPEGSRNDRMLLYLHGGGFVFGLSGQHLRMVAELARRSELRTLLVDYRLAPRHPWPAALEDCLAVYRWLLEQGLAPQHIVVAGDSAGGNLAITMVMALRDARIPLPAALACLSPVGDLTPRNQEGRVAGDAVLHPRAIRRFNRSYIADHDPRHPLISPLYGDWHGLPPLLIHAGEEELLREDAERIAAAARAAGVEVELAIFPRMWHVWQLNVELPQAQESLHAIARWLVEQLNSANEQRTVPTDHTG
ncbi:alpha/beta hydrolase [Thermomicrobium sp. CFH 73360]|uniref:alpha/beta hydrolase n=1 Tax=Thermomicrobium sp. CFH 73360 TaxID=2951987 RepID=UPI0020772387|nr:alpha/beta hydrolase [Thermomicrobium sp. CFH 73360]MCM8746364.1 alpha/beta hydrolase [Thermomicrobium sp. CFH 73360]